MRAILVLALFAAVAVSPALGYRAYADAILKATDDPISAQQLFDIATRKASCPFVGSLVNQRLIPIGQSVEKPLAQVQAVVNIGNSGKGSTLGYVLRLFATGNHAKQLGPSGRLDQPVPSGWFSLDLAGSQGSHPGHSGVLEGNPQTVNGGRWSQPDFDRLLAKAQGGLLTTKAFGEYIGENIKRDPASRTVTGGGLLSVLLPDSLKLFGTIGSSLWTFLRNPAAAKPGDWRNAITALTKLLGDDNLIGSAGEFGLLLAFLERSPNTRRTASGETGFSVAEVTQMFQRRELPQGWEQWTKSALSWMTFSSQLTYHARHRLNALH